MVSKVLGEFSVEYLQVMDELGVVDKKLKPSMTTALIKKMYEQMVFARIFDDKAVNLQRQGRLGTYASIKGQEASQIGSALAIDKGDWVVPSFREQGVYLSLGLHPTMLYQSWGGDERGMKIPDNLNILPISIPIATHLLHAVGLAMAAQYKKEKRVAITYFGDGGTSEGDFHEAMNFAGEFKSPVVFLCQNNQYAISLSVKDQTASATIAQKAIAYGFEGVRVDGNDVFAVYKATKDAVKKARAGKGPTLIECFTYRIGDHTTSDDAAKYRGLNEVREWGKKDPIVRLEKFMVKNKLANNAYCKSVREKMTARISDAVAQYESIPAAPVSDMFKYLFAGPTPIMNAQFESMSLIKSEKKVVVDKKEVA